MALKIAFGYKARSGKDTAGDHIVSKNPRSHILKFSASLYDMTRDIYARAGIPWEKHRPLLQYLGTSWGRSIDENIWINILLKQVNEMNSDSNILCVTDLRFTNEANALKKNGFFLVKVDRRQDLKPDVENPNHPSEIDLDDYDGWDVIVSNNDTIESYLQKIDSVVDSFRNS